MATEIYLLGGAPEHLLTVNDRSVSIEEWQEILLRIKGSGKFIIRKPDNLKFYSNLVDIPDYTKFVIRNATIIGDTRIDEGSREGVRGHLYKHQRLIILDQSGKDLEERLPMLLVRRL